MITFFSQSKGSVLLFALLVMSGTILTSLTVGTIVLNEIRQSRNIDDAITAYYIAESGIEQGVYLYKKDNGTFQSEIEEVDVDEPVPVGGADPCYFEFDNFHSGNMDCVSYWQESPTQLFSLTPGQVQQVNLFNDALSSGYGVESVEITWTDNNPSNGVEPWLEVEYVELRRDFQAGVTKVFIQKCGNTGGEVICTPINNSTYSVATQHPSSSSNYKLRFRALYDSITVQVTAFDGNTGGDVIANRSVDIYATGEYRSSLQSLRAQVSSGVLTTKGFADFVLFSDCDITKGYGTSSACP